MSARQESQLLRMQGITKFFPGVKALDDVTLELNQGEVLAVIGENGAGKSTLVKVLGGVHQPDMGTITLDGEDISIDSVHTATDLGIAFVHQELNLSDNLDVAANVYLGREPRKQNLLKLIDRKKISQDTEALLKRIDLDCSPRTLVRDLTIGTQQMIEIAKALSMNARILIMDEPTSSLSQHETEQLFRVIGELRSQGVSIIYISHRLGEVKEVADRVTVLRDGCVSGHLERKEIHHENMIKLMVGRDIETFYHHEHEASKIPVFEVRNFLVPGQPNKPINLTVHAGEILVLAGLVGAGRTELAHALFGIDESLGGKILLNDTPIVIRSPQEAIQAGIALVPEDRKQYGLIVEMAVENNITLAGLDRYQKMKMILFDKVKSVANEMVKQLDVRLRDIEQVAESLSGGNQQKVVLAKWLSLAPKVLLLDEPTRGIDVVAKEEIYRLMEGLAAEGVAMLVISSEMQEVIGIADRILVMHEGRISGELRHKEEFTEEAVVSLATGGE
ncbi:MAG: sugar ABC transporter ATP-binding protein [bacterium]|nr:sugar ABC transporter ATP-binding protein [bacterium]